MSPLTHRAAMLLYMLHIYASMVAYSIKLIAEKNLCSQHKQGIQQTPIEDDEEPHRMLTADDSQWKLPHQLYKKNFNTAS